METKLHKEKTISSIILIALYGVAAVYILVLLKIVLFKNGFTTELRELNFIPFRFVTDFFEDKENIDVVLKNIIGNFALFIPLGILIPSLFKKVSVKKTILICFGVSLSFEIIQYIIGLGISDVDDLILNTFGGIVGTVIYFAFLKKIDNKVNKKIATLVFLSIFGICGILSLYLYEPRIVPNRVKFINKEILEGLDANNYDIQTTCTGIDKDNLFTDTKKRFFGNNYKNANNKDGRYVLDDNTKLFVEKKQFKYSPNGNIQKTTVVYGKITKEEFKKMINQEEHGVRLWMLDDNKCKIVVITQNIKLN